MQQPSQYANTRQLSMVMISAVIGLLLLESRGLVVWANRLDTGVLQQVARPITEQVATTLSPLRIGDFRQVALHALEVIGWSEQTTQPPQSAAEDPNCLLAPVTAVPPSPLNVTIPSTELAALPLQNTLPASLAQLSTQSQVHIGLVGDSMMAVGLSAVLQQQYSVKDRVQFIRAFKSGTGLARPDSYDWQQQYPILLGTQRPDVVIVSIGANDAQNFVEQNKIISFGSSAWQQIYAERVVQFMQLLTQDGTPVIWVGLPPMKKPTFDQKIQQINRLTYSIVKQYPNSAWWNPAPYLTDSQGQFVEFGDTSTGQTVRLRAIDGIHLSNEGAQRLAVPLMQWLQPIATAPANR